MADREPHHTPATLGTSAGSSGPPAETAALLDCLEAQVDHALGVVADLGEDDLGRAPLPSGWTPRWMLTHLTLGLHYWFEGVIAGSTDARGPEPAAFRRGRSSDPRTLLREQMDRARRIAAPLPSTRRVAWIPEKAADSWPEGTVRGVLLHEIAEFACHAGHLDAALELRDGRQWLVLEEPR